MIKRSGAFDNPDFDGNTILVENGGKYYVFISVCDVLKLNPEKKL